MVEKGDDECPKELESIGRKIVEKCNGLPLAISVRGDLLVGKQTKCGWEQVLYQINSHLGRTESSVSSILELSYLNLSPQLKSCFLCLALFKEDVTIPAKRLLHIWVAQGLIQQEGRTRVEEIGRGYLDELINRNMVQIKDLNLDDRVKDCQLHDLVREVCLRKAKEEIGFEILKAEERTTSTESSSKKPRHRVVYDENWGCFSLEHNKHLRSLFLVNVDINNYAYTGTRSYWKNFQLLKILDVDGFELRRFPRSFGALIGLKYLRIHGHIPGNLELPSWLDHFKKLEVLDMGKFNCVEFPKVVKLDRLRYFRGRIYGAPVTIDIWKNIESLKYMRVEDWMRCSSRLADSCPVRELGIILDPVTERYELSRMRVSLEKLKNLVKLHLLWSIQCPIQAALVIPNLGNLTKLKLRCWMMECPGASMFPPNLSHLTLVDSCLFEDPMPELGKLPNLFYLKLGKNVYRGWRMKALHDGFPCLKSLSLLHLKYLRGIDIEEGGMLHLKHLRIQYCRSLKTENLPEHIIISAE